MLDEPDIRVPALRALLRAWMISVKGHDPSLYLTIVTGIRQGLAAPEFGPQELRSEAHTQFEALVESPGRL